MGPLAGAKQPPEVGGPNEWPVVSPILLSQGTSAGHEGRLVYFELAIYIYLNWLVVRSLSHLIRDHPRNLRMLAVLALRAGMNFRNHVHTSRGMSLDGGREGDYVGLVSEQGLLKNVRDCVRVAQLLQLHIIENQLLFSKSI